MTMTDEVSLSEYLFIRLHQLGIRAVHGVPGDYNLTLLEFVEPAGLRWVGNANELNSAYAADGYARVRGISAVVTAFGVGELSAINAIAGAYAERVPVIHIVGTPSTKVQNNKMLVHHTLGNGDFGVFAKAAALFTVAQANLTEITTATGEIDRVLRECLRHKRPIYIQFPMDMVYSQVNATALKHPIEMQASVNGTASHETATDLVLKEIYASKSPIIIVDGTTARYGLVPKVNDLIRRTKLPTYVTTFGKGCVDEDYCNFRGVITPQTVKDWDLCLRFGPLDSDVNTDGFKVVPDSQLCIDILPEKTSIRGSSHSVTFSNMVEDLLANLDLSKIPKTQQSPITVDAQSLDKHIAMKKDKMVGQEEFYKYISKFFRQGDILLSETGSAGIGCRDFVLPVAVPLITTPLWLSIGYMTASASGAALAQREMIAEAVLPPGRTILFTGDGSLQMTVQALSDMVRNRMDVIIFILNNDGYTVERWIHGMEASYNDIQPWRYTQALDFFGAPRDDPAYPVTTRTVTKWGELDSTLGDQILQAGKGIHLIEIIMTREDAPQAMKDLCLAAGGKSSA